MNRFSSFTAFVRTFFRYSYELREVIGMNLLLIFAGGAAFSRFEGIKLGDSVYFAFITAFSIGYGDITPKTVAGRLVSIGIGFIGMLFVGLSVAVATRALRDTIDRLDHARDNTDSAGS